MRTQVVIIIMVFVSYFFVYMIVFHMQWWSVRSTSLEPILSTQPMPSLISHNRFDPNSDVFKEGVYNQCKSFSQTSRWLGPLQRNNSNGQLFFPNQNTTLQDVYLLLRYSPRRDDEGGLDLQLATSYLLSQNLQRLSIQQQARTRVAVFLSKKYTKVMYNRLERWFKSIYVPYTIETHIIRTIDGNQASWKYMMNYAKHNKEIHMDTILFLLEDDYIFEEDMLSDTIEFFASHNPCFVHQTDYPDRCRLDMNDDNGHLVVPGKTRLWRSIPSTTVTYACRLRTFLVFEDIMVHPKNDWGISPRSIRTRVGNTAIFCAIPSYSTHIETLLLPHDINSTTEIDTAAYYKDWWSLARHALSKAQNKDTFPAPKINERKLFRNELSIK